MKILLIALLLPTFSFADSLAENLDVDPHFYQPLIKVSPEVIEVSSSKIPLVGGVSVTFVNDDENWAILTLPCKWRGTKFDSVFTEMKKSLNMSKKLGIKFSVSEMCKKVQPITLEKETK